MMNLPDTTEEKGLSTLRCFPDSDSQAQSLASHIAETLNVAIRERGQASIAFSGGSTPKPMFQCLAQQAVDWSSVQVTLVDERCVDTSSERSNARLLQESLFDALKVKPQFYPLYLKDESMRARVERFARFSLPFDIVHLGMGEDAHTASFFPDAANIAQMLDADTPHRFFATQSGSSGEARITWSLSSLLNARSWLLQMCGNRKRMVLDEVMDILRQVPKDQPLNADLACRYPILGVLEHSAMHRSSGVPITIYCADE